MDTLTSLWEYLLQQQVAPGAAIVIITAVVAAAMVVVDVVWRRARNVITIAHEGGHALVAVLTGRSLRGIRLHSDTSGMTYTRGQRRGLSAVLTLLAGYLAPALLGLGAAWMVWMGLVVLLLWVILALLLVMALFIRNFYGILAIVLTGLGVFAIAWWAPADVQATLAYGGVWFLLFGSVRPVWEVSRQRRRTRERTSDPDQLAEITPVPATAWLVFFALANVAVLAYGAQLLIPGIW